MDSRLVSDKIIFLQSNKRLVLPHFFFIENIGMEEKMIFKWKNQLVNSDSQKYISILKDDNLIGSLFTYYPHPQDAILLDEIIMINHSGVVNLVKYVYRKKKKDNQKCIELLELFNSVFSQMEKSRMRKNVFDDIIYEDQQYKNENMSQNIQVNNSPGAVVNTIQGDKNKATIENYSNNSSPNEGKTINWFRYGFVAVVFVVVVCTLFMVYIEYKQSQDLTLALEKTIKRLFALVDVCSFVVS